MPKRKVEEYGKLCQSCYKRTKSRMYFRRYKRTKSRMYFRPCIGVKGKNKNKMIWRRVCIICWDMANENQL
jgi:hypothetical protein